MYSLRFHQNEWFNDTTVYSICMSSMTSSILHIHFHSPDIMFLGTTPANQPDSPEYMPRGGGVGRASSWPIRWAYMTKLLPSYRRRVWWCCVSAHCGQTIKGLSYSCKYSMHFPQVMYDLLCKHVLRRRSDITWVFTNYIPGQIALCFLLTQQ